MKWFTVENPKAANLLLDGSSRFLLEPFLLSSSSVKEVADAMGMPLESVYYQVKRFERYGLLEVAALEQRQGRPIKRYRAVAEGFFVPFHITPYNTLEGFVNHVQTQLQSQFNTLMAEVGRKWMRDPKRAGFRVYRVDDYVTSDLTPDVEMMDILSELLAPDAPAMMSSHIPLKLSRSDAKALQREMLELMLRYSGRNGDESYIAHVGLVPGEYDWR